MNPGTFVCVHGYRKMFLNAPARADTDDKDGWTHAQRFPEPREVRYVSRYASADTFDHSGALGDTCTLAVVKHRRLAPCLGCNPENWPNKI